MVRGRRTARRACVSAFGYGFDRVCLGSTKAHIPSVQLTRTAADRETEATQRANRQKGKLAEASQEGEKGSQRKTKVKKWETRPRGGGGEK